MPIFEYACADCAENFEKLIFGSQVVLCPNCSSGNIKKKMSSFGMSGGERTTAGASSGCTSCSKGSCSSCG